MQPDNIHAFPTDEYYDEKLTGVSSGMTLRDYFAAQSMQAILPVADSNVRRNGEEGVLAKAADYARVAYAVADAMLEARAR